MVKNFLNVGEAVCWWKIPIMVFKRINGSDLQKTFQVSFFELFLCVYNIRLLMIHSSFVRFQYSLDSFKLLYNFGFSFCL